MTKLNLQGLEAKIEAEKHEANLERLLVVKQTLQEGQAAIKADVEAAEAEAKEAREFLQACEANDEKVLSLIEQIGNKPEITEEDFASLAKLLIENLTAELSL